MYIKCLDVVNVLKKIKTQTNQYTVTVTIIKMKSILFVLKNHI